MPKPTAAPSVEPQIAALDIDPGTLTALPADARVPSLPAGYDQRPKIKAAADRYFEVNEKANDAIRARQDLARRIEAARAQHQASVGAARAAGHADPGPGELQALEAQVPDADAEVRAWVQAAAEAKKTAELAYSSDASDWCQEIRGRMAAGLDRAATEAAALTRTIDAIEADAAALGRMTGAAPLLARIDTQTRTHIASNTARALAEWANAEPATGLPGRDEPIVHLS